VRHLDAFAGIGGFSVAAEKVGIETVAFVERDPFCRSLLGKHFPGRPVFDDIKTFSGGEVGAIDLVTAGIPCQPYSIAGKRKGADDERALWPELERVVGIKRPAWVVVENVIGFASMALEPVLDGFQAMGYSALPIRIPACAAGSPQLRERVFIVALSDVAYGNGAGRQGGDHDWRQDQEWKSVMGHLGRCVASAAPRWPAGPGEATFLWEKVRLTRAEPGVGRTVNGLPYGVDRSFRIGRKPRLRALGNCVVPYQVLPILAAIKIIHDKATGEVQ